MTDEELKQAIELDSKRSSHQVRLNEIQQFESNVPEASKDVDPWDDIDIVASGPDDSLIMGNIPTQLKTDILALVKEYHSKQIDNINKQIQEL